jgi:hypothetical protein
MLPKPGQIVGACEPENPFSFVGIHESSADIFLIICQWVSLFPSSYGVPDHSAFDEFEIIHLVVLLRRGFACFFLWNRVQTTFEKTFAPRSRTCDTVTDPKTALVLLLAGLVRCFEDPARGPG